MKLNLICARYFIFEDEERDELLLNLVNTLTPAQRQIQERMGWHFTQCDPDYGRRVADGLGALRNFSRKRQYLCQWLPGMTAFHESHPQILARLTESRSGKILYCCLKM